MTVVMGYAAVRWFETGEKISSETFKKLTQEMTSFLLQRLKGLGKRKPKEGRLREEIELALENMPLADNRETFDKEAGE